MLRRYFALLGVCVGVSFAHPPLMLAWQEAAPIAPDYLLISQPLRTTSDFLKNELAIEMKENQLLSKKNQQLAFVNAQLRQEATPRLVPNVTIPDGFNRTTTNTLPIDHTSMFCLAILLASMLWWGVLQSSQAREIEVVDVADKEYDFLSTKEALPAKLDLAEAYIAMGDMNSAQAVLSEVLVLGDASQQAHAKRLLTRLSD